MAVKLEYTEDLRVLLNLLQVDYVLAAHFLKNKPKETARVLLDEIKNSEVESLYKFFTR